MKCNGNRKPNSPNSSNKHILGWCDSSQTLGFSKKNKQDLSLIHYDKAGHQMTIGRTGIGKGVSAAIPQALSFDGSMIIFDPKGEIEAVTRRYREKVLGQSIVTLSPFAETSDGLNPLDLFLKNITHDSAQDFANEVASMVAGSSVSSANSRGSSNDQFWMDSGVNLLTGVIGCALEGKLKCNTLNAVVETLKNDDVVYALAVLLDTSPPSADFQREIASFLQMTDVTRSGVLATAQSYLRGLSGRTIRKMFQRTTFDLKGFTAGIAPTTIYLRIPIDKLVSHFRLVRLIMGTLISALFARDYIPNHKTLILLDEVGALGTFELLRTLLTVMRGQGVIAHTMWQDLAQVKLNYYDWETILNNHGVIRLLGASNFGQANQMADFFGVSPRRLMELKSNEQALIVEGEFTVCRRLNYLVDPYFGGRFDPNPRHADPNAGKPFPC